jgi:hypothetical protein
MAKFYGMQYNEAVQIQMGSFAVLACMPGVVALKLAGPAH